MLDLCLVRGWLHLAHHVPLDLGHRRVSHLLEQILGLGG